MDNVFKFEVGDKVVIKKQLRGDYVVSHMKPFCGKVVTISRRNANNSKVVFYDLEEDKGHWWFAEHHIDRKATDEDIKNDILAEGVKKIDECLSIIDEVRRSFTKLNDSNADYLIPVCYYKCKFCGDLIPADEKEFIQTHLKKCFQNPGNKRCATCSSAVMQVNKAYLCTKKNILARTEPNLTCDDYRESYGPILRI